MELELGDSIDPGKVGTGFYGHKPGCPDGIACIHGSLRRSCEICERDARIAELERQLAEARRELESKDESLRAYSAKVKEGFGLLAAARAEVERLRGLLERAHSYIAGDAPDWEYGHLRDEIAAAISAQPAEKPGEEAKP